jgi:acyl transferase domain-containing protein
MADEAKLREYLRKATVELQQSRRQLTAREARDAEPVAVLGIGCRYPGGVRSPEDLWELVEQGRDAVGPLSGDRGWQLDGRLADFRGGFVTGLAEFDAGFFGISEGEARAMDPQQRLLLETSWEAVERAGIDPTTLHGSRTGVYTGLTSSGYVMVLGGSAPPEETLDYIGVGSSPGAAAGRISYLLGLHGPAMTIDTACSSSLVALHVATQALRRGECSLALAGGAAACVLPYVFLEFERRGSLAADGRSKSFSAGADGVSFAEGAGMLLLERLSDAQANGHRILALIRGTAVNQDGETNGLSAPSSAAQERVIRDALADARLGADQIDVIEGHGVGSVFADGIEARSLIATYGRDRAAGDWVRLGSVKSNIGHTQAAGGVAGVIKTVMALRNEVVPATLHADRPTPHADWSAGSVRLQTEPEPWPPRPDRARRAAVSCFSISGTNGHLILEEAPPDGDRETSSGIGDPQPVAVPWPISAKSESGLRAQATRLRAVVGRSAPADVGHSLAVTRSTFKHRAVVVAATAAEFVAALDALACGQDAPGLARGTADPRGRTAFLFPEVQRRHPDAAREIRCTLPAFASAWAELIAVAKPDGSDGEPQRSAAEETFLVQIALARTASAFGVGPDLVVGQGVGEIAAGHCAGVLTLADAWALVTACGDGPQLDLDALRTALNGVTFGPPQVPVLSVALGREATDLELARPGRWLDRIQQAGDPAVAIDHLERIGVRRRLSFDADRLERRALLTALAGLHTGGAAVDWAAAFAGLGAEVVDLPTYPFRTGRYWLTALDEAGLDEAALDEAALDEPDLEGPELVPGFGQRKMGMARTAEISSPG